MEKNKIHADRHEIVIDEIDDLHMPWQNVSNHLSGPPLKSLWQDGVVGVSTALVGDVPGLKKKELHNIKIEKKTKIKKHFYPQLCKR